MIQVFCPTHSKDWSVWRQIPPSRDVLLSVKSFFITIISYNWKAGHGDNSRVSLLFSGHLYAATHFPVFTQLQEGMVSNLYKESDTFIFINSNTWDLAVH